MYTVKEAAARMGLSEHTVRYYTDKGLVPSLKRDKNNNRLFDEESMNWLSTIKCLRDCGMSIEAIREYCELCLEGDSTIRQRYQIILSQMPVAQQQLEEARQRVKYLEKKAERYRKIMDHQIPDVMNPATWPTKSVG